MSVATGGVGREQPPGTGDGKGVSPVLCKTHVGGS